MASGNSSRISNMPTNTLLAERLAGALAASGDYFESGGRLYCTDCGQQAGGRHSEGCYDAQQERKRGERALRLREVAR